MSEQPTELACERLHPFMQTLWRRAHGRACRLHADSVSLEHLVGAAMEDEDSAAYALVEHAFADPETISNEMLALSPGVMVVSSKATLPFSPRAMDVLAIACAARATDDDDKVSVALLLEAAVAGFDAAVRDEFAQAGFQARTDVPNTVIEPLPASPFSLFTKRGLQALSRANQIAHQQGEQAIGPAQLVLGSLRLAPELAASHGVSWTAASSLLAGHARDETPLAARTLGSDTALVDFLAQLPDGAGSLGLLTACHGPDTPEIKELLLRHKVTEALIARSLTAFEDPESD